MKKKNMYSIGEISEICNISKKTLRYYDEIGLITSKRNDTNNYRYYTLDSLLTIPVLKYFKQIGFKLNEIVELTANDTSDTYGRLKTVFKQKMFELSEEQELLRQRYVSVNDWRDLLSEADMVIENDIHEISIKYVPEAVLLCQEQISTNSPKGDIINIEWTNYVEELENAITGPVIIKYHSIDDRLNNIDDQKITVLQKSMLPANPQNEYTFGNSLMLSYYHIGEHENLPQVYEKIQAWAKKHRYKLENETYERYVTDYWTNCHSSKFVTEILIKISR